MAGPADESEVDLPAEHNKESDIVKCIKCGKPATAEVWNLSHPAHSVGCYCQDCIDFREKAEKIAVFAVLAIVFVVAIFL